MDSRRGRWKLPRLFLCVQEDIAMIRYAVLCFVWILAMPAGTFAGQIDRLAGLKEEIRHEFGGMVPKEWGENVNGVRNRMKTGDRVLALTLDACGSARGKGYDRAMIEYLIRENIPAMLFINARWIDANPDVFASLAANPLFEIANHGLLHRPASVNGKGIYGIAGTRSLDELVDEIEVNALKIQGLTGKRPRYYRSGTAYYDEVAVSVSQRLGHEVIGFSILGDAGATYKKEQVRAAMLAARNGDIAILHMNHPEAESGAGLIAAIPELKRRGFRFVRLSDYGLVR